MNPRMKKKSARSTPSRLLMNLELDHYNFNYTNSTFLALYTRYVSYLPINKIYSATVPPTACHHCKIANQGQDFTGINFPEDHVMLWDSLLRSH